MDNLKFAPSNNSNCLDFDTITNDHNYCSNKQTMNIISGKTISNDDVNNQNEWQIETTRNKRHLSTANVSDIKKPCRPTEYVAKPARAIELHNRFEMLSNASLGSEEETMNDDECRTKVRPPPIFVPNIVNISKMMVNIEQVIKKESYSFKCIARDKVKINTDTIEAYRALVKHLTNMKVNFHTYQIKGDRAYRVVLKNMHFSTEPQEIKTAIEAYNHKVRNVSNLRSSKSKDPLSIFFVDLEPAPNNKDIFKIEFLLNAKIVFEPPYKRNDVVQCKKCQRYGHTKAYCWYQNRCVKCGSDHDTSSCNKSVNVPPKCVLCGGEHPANYKGCSIYRDIKKKAFPPLRPALKKDIPPPVQDREVDRPTSVRTQNSTGNQSQPVSPTLSYARVASGQSNVEANHNLNQIIDGFLNKFEMMMSQQAQQIGTLINLLTTVISKLK